MITLWRLFSISKSKVQRSSVYTLIKRVPKKIYDLIITMLIWTNTATKSNKNMRMLVFGLYECVPARRFTKRNFCHLLSYGLKFCIDQSFRWKDISLFVTVYDLELEISSFSNPSKNAILNGKKRTLRFISNNFFSSIISLRHLLPYKQKKVWKSEIYWPHKSE